MGGTQKTSAPDRERGPPIAVDDSARPRLGRRGVAGLLGRHADAVAVLVLAAFVLVYLWPVLLGGRHLSPLTILYAFDPWRAFVPPDVNAHFNPVLVDVPAADYPWRWLVRELLHQGVFPAWNRHVFAGVPLYANPQTGLFSPFSLPLWVLPLGYGIGVAAALKLWVAGCGTYLLARELRMSPLAGVLAGVCFGFCAFNIVWLTHETLPAVAAMLPWAVWLTERIFRGGRLGSALGLAAATAIALGGGHPGAQVHVLVLIGLYAVLRAMLVPDASRRERLQALAVTCGAVAVGGLLMAFMLVPELLLGRGTVGTAARSHGGTLPGSKMPFDAIRTVAFPDWWGRPSAYQTRLGGRLVNYNERTFYAGSVALLLAVIGLLRRDAWRRRAPFAVLGVIGLAVPLHAPGLYWLATHLPLLSRVQSQRLHLAFAFAVAVLAAAGLQDLLERPREVRWRLLVPVVALALAAAACAGAGIAPGDVGRTLRHFVSGDDFPRPGVVELTSVAWFALFALGVAGGLVAVWRWPERRSIVAAGLVLLAMADAYHFAHGYQPMPPAATAAPPATPAIAYLQRHARGSRIVGLGPTLLNDWSLLYGLDDIRGYDPPQPTERFDRIWRLANPAQTPWRQYWITDFSGSSLRVVSILGARYVVGPPDVTAPPPAEPGLRPLQGVYGGTDATVFLNPNAVPRAMVPASIVVTGGERETLGALAEPGFDPLHTVAVERDQPGVRALAGERPGGEAAVIGQDNARVTMRATLDRAGLVVLNDALAPGWTVRVDGDAATPVRVNDVMRGVVVGPGRHDVVWSYAVPGLRLGVALSLAALAAIVGALAVHLGVGRRRRRGRSAAAGRDLGR